jgi:DNA-binding protein HU-beta
MKKPDLVKKVRDIANLESDAAAKRAVDAVLEAIKEGLLKDGEVQFVGFGTFKVKDVPARTYRNPLTGKPTKRDATKKVAFKVGSELKESVKKAKKGGKKK